MQLFAHRGMPGPAQNTLGGVRRALELGYPGVEIDLAVTADGVAILSHDPWLHEEYGVARGRGSLDGRVLIKDHSLSDLRERYLVGAPAEPIATLHDVLDAMADYPVAQLYLDLKIEPPRLKLTAGAQEMARAVDAALSESPREATVWVECGSAFIRRVVSEAVRHPVRLVASFPRYVADTGDTWEALMAGARDLLGVEEPHDVAQAMEVQHFAAAAQLITEGSVQEARRAGVGAFLFGVDDAKGLQRVADWPLEGAIVDHFDGALG